RDLFGSAWRSPSVRSAPPSTKGTSMPSRTTRGFGTDGRRDAGRAARVPVPRRALGEWDASRRTHDALEVIVAQSHDRVPELVPIRHGRMAATPWTHYRGA